MVTWEVYFSNPLRIISTLTLHLTFKCLSAGGGMEEESFPFISVRTDFVNCQSRGELIIEHILISQFQKFKRTEVQIVTPNIGGWNATITTTSSSSSLPEESQIKQQKQTIFIFPKRRQSNKRIHCSDSCQRCGPNTARFAERDFCTSKIVSARRYITSGAPRCHDE